ncbi:hypothetical protein [Methylosinus sp. C49]|uniref:hypothetical protein n=1 Tax=Methylosinus sp. C49 TaxID=2699395 RepID=UPI001FCE9646|nr:hypothetical protein [Methylosinus sp. C49]
MRVPQKGAALSISRDLVKQDFEVYALSLRPVIELPRGDASRHLELILQCRNDGVEFSARHGRLREPPDFGGRRRRQKQLSGERFRSPFYIERHPTVQNIDRSERMATIEQQMAKLMRQRHIGRSPHPAPTVLVEKNSRTETIAPDSEGVQCRRIDLPRLERDAEVGKERGNVDRRLRRHAQMLADKAGRRLALFVSASVREVFSDMVPDQLAQAIEFRRWRLAECADERQNLVDLLGRQRARHSRRDPQLVVIVRRIGHTPGRREYPVIDQLRRSGLVETGDPGEQSGRLADISPAPVVDQIRPSTWTTRQMARNFISETRNFGPGLLEQRRAHSRKRIDDHAVAGAQHPQGRQIEIASEAVGEVVRLLERANQLVLLFCHVGLTFPSLLGLSSKFGRALGRDGDGIGLAKGKGLPKFDKMREQVVDLNF